MRSIIDITELSTKEIEELVDTAKDIMEYPEKYAKSCEGKKLATLFFEPSTRTRLSFEAAMQELGGSVLSVTGAAASSAAKGESVADTAKIVSCYADIIAMRHSLEGSAYVAAKNASIPVINAGDGGHCHPTQTTADLLTINRELGRFSDLTIGLCGDLLYGRTTHSLINALSRYENNKFILISPEELKLPGYTKEKLSQSGCLYEETESLEEAIPKLDVLYMTRIQRERFEDEAQYERLKDSYRLTAEKMKSAKREMCVLHPLPRVNEISVDVDPDRRACYFDEALNGKYMRMALILKLLKENEKDVLKRGTTRHFMPDYIPEGLKDKIEVNGKCKNPKCITCTEQELPQLFADGKCIYCEHDM